MSAMDDSFLLFCLSARLLFENVIFELLWHHKKYDKTNSFVAIYDKSWHACCVVNDTELQNNLCRFVEGMAPVFSQSAWYCTWHLIQNDLVHGWGVDMKLGYCAQGDRTKKVGVVDSEYVFHKGIQTLGGSGHRMTKVYAFSFHNVGIHFLLCHCKPKYSVSAPTWFRNYKGQLCVDFLSFPKQKQGGVGIDVRTEIRRQSTWEFEIFKERWNKAIGADKNWVDPFKSDQRRIRKWRDTQRLAKNNI
ncbi:hypothetical protein GmHk_15G043023 [Glycine max]|nr:hypothetical protein GmHk_15G043023 [Glycine max]